MDESGPPVPEGLPPEFSRLVERLLKERIVFIGTPIDDFISQKAIDQLLYLETKSRRLPIHLYVNSPGGYVSSSIAILDTLEKVRPKVFTYCLGQASGMAALLVAAGERGRRYALPNSQFQLVALEGGDGSKTTAGELERLGKVVRNLVAKTTGQGPEQVALDLSRGITLEAVDAKRYGLVDHIIERLPLDEGVHP